MTFGILTLATPNDYKKAIGLALSIRVSNPGVPIAVACSPKLRPLLAQYFDHVVDEDPTLRGFVHKVHLDRYSPFDETFFFDSDVLVFRSLSEVIDDWREQPYTACGIYVTGGFSTFGLDRVQVLKKINRGQLVQIDGAGHAYFRKPECHKVFDLAREVTEQFQEYAGDIPYADEDVMDIAMTLLDLKPMPYSDFFSRYCSAIPGTMEMDATLAKCQFVFADTKKPLRPYMMHFAANEAPFPYARQLKRLFKKFDVDPSGLYATAIADFYETDIKWRVSAYIKKLADR